MRGQHDYSTNLVNLTEPTKPYLSWVSMGVEFSRHPGVGMIAQLFGVADRAWHEPGKHAQA